MKRELIEDRFQKKAEDILRSIASPEEVTIVRQKLDVLGEMVFVEEKLMLGELEELENKNKALQERVDFLEKENEGLLDRSETAYDDGLIDGQETERSAWIPVTYKGEER
jgi:hypothetical protein